jgi:histidine triad (HIT) family protein
MNDCAFCRIVRREIPAEVVFESDTALAFFPPEPATRGHTLVIPKQHVEDFLHLASADLPALGDAVLRVGHGLEAALSPQGMNVISSAGAAASQTVGHLHVHLVPRWHGDAVGEIWPPKRPTPEAVLEGLADRVRQRLHSGELRDRNPE